MKNRQKDLISLLVVFLLAAIALYLMFSTKPRLGLDLRGGMNVVLTAKETKQAKVTESAIKQAKFIIEQRVNALGVAEPQIERQVGTPNIIVQLPGIKDPQKALDIIGKTALLEFKAVSDTDSNPKHWPTVMTGKSLKSASVGFDQVGAPKVNMVFTSQGARRFEKVTGALVGKKLAIVLDGKVMSSPNVNAKISGGSAEITGKFSLDEVKNLVLVLNTGALPVNLEVTEKRIIGPTLGQDSLDQGLRAGLIGLALVALYLLLAYRGLGLISITGLIIFSALFGGILILIKATLTLPGIAGIIMTIGLASDSSVVFFERFREEVNKGKSPRSAAGQGFTYAFRTIIDADAVSLIIALTLIFLSYVYFGAGPVRGFAFTLSIGTVTDVFTAFFFTRPALQTLSEFSLFKNPAFIGVEKSK